MTLKKLIDNKSSIVLVVSRTMLAIVLVIGLYTLFDKEQIAAKLLAMGGSIGIAFLLALSFKSTLKAGK